MGRYILLPIHWYFDVNHAVAQFAPTGFGGTLLLQIASKFHTDTVNDLGKGFALFQACTQHTNTHAVCLTPAKTRTALSGKSGCHVSGQTFCKDTGITTLLPKNFVAHFRTSKNKIRLRRAKSICKCVVSASGGQGAMKIRLSRTFQNT